MKKVRFSILVFLIVFTAVLKAQETAEEKTRRMQWFKEAKLGIFIHWGIYAVDGIDESWSFFNGYISYTDYMKQLKGFTASKYRPEEWAELIKESGAKYAVLTSKHHDGVALWDTKYSDLNVVKKTPAGKDLIKPYCEALRKSGLKVGLYFSHLDWSHPDYPHFTREEKRYKDDTARWERFLKFQRGQIEEISKKYKPDLLWFDGDWDYSADVWKARELREQIFQWLPNTIVNSRINGYGDYATPEQGLPVVKPESECWELCMTMNDSWGFQHNDKNYKSPNQIIRIFVDCISMGGNLLLDIGPEADGTIPPEQVNILKELGRWTKKHSDAVYGTTAGIPFGHFYGPTVLSKDKQLLYLFLDYKPKGPVVIKGLKNQINRIWVLGNGTKLSWEVKMKQYWSAVPGIVYIDVPEQVLDEQVTVLAVLLKGPVDLHR
ncbi:alpha-L-fucosidase [candidate division KSB1 bacterium]